MPDVPVQTPHSVALHTLGCKLNQADTGALERGFRRRGFTLRRFGQTADVTVINTCTVTAEADRKARQAIRRARRASPDGFLVVTGCYAQLAPEHIAALPEVDLILGTGEKHRLFEFAGGFERRARTQVEVSCMGPDTPFGAGVTGEGRTRAFLKIQDGCDYRCSFCTIPAARGASRSDTVDRVVASARDLADRGVREIVLSGVNIGLFGRDTGESLLGLLRALDRISEIDRFRISSIEPNLLSDEIIDFVAGSRAFVPHFHVPLQSGDNAVLAGMRRRYRRQVYADRADRIMALLPDACIGADVIAGFPGETADAFDNTCRFVADLPVAYLHPFTYSERAGTVAAERLSQSGDVVPVPERSRRTRRLQILSGRKRQAFYDRMRGSTRRVLWESERSDGRIEGFTDNYVRVSALVSDNRCGRLDHVVLGGVRDDGTVAAAPAAL